MNGKKVLTVGVAYKPVQGGIAAVENAYATFYKPFNHIATAPVGINSNIRKLFQFCYALTKFLWFMLFHREIHIVHLHVASNASFWRKWIIINLAKAFRKKVVFHLHSGHFQDFYSHHHWVVKKTLEKCDCVIALSDYWRQWIGSTFNCKKVVVINNVIETPKLARVPHDGFVLLFLGQLVEAKGIYDLLDVIATHKAEFAGRLQLIIGGNKNVEKLKRIITQYRLSNIVKFEGWVSGQKKSQMFNMADAFILPSYREGLPISILEAESYALPVISTQVGGIPEIVSDSYNGILFKPGDKVAMYEAIVRLMTDERLRMTMGTKSGAVTKTHLSGYVENQLAELYSQLLS